MIRLDNISINIAQKQILSQVNCQINKGEITAVLGSNGAGKSTLFKCLTALLKPDSGQIIFDDKNLSNYSLSELAKKRAVLSQNININFPFRVDQIVEMGLYNVEDLPYRKDLIIESLKLVEAADLIDRTFTTLSGGEKQRVNLARVLAQIITQDNPYLFLDEPTSALDLKYQHLLLKLLVKLKKEINLTSCIIIHDINLAHFYVDNVILLKGGKVYKTGKKDLVLSKENLALTYDVYPEEIARSFIAFE